MLSIDVRGLNALTIERDLVDFEVKVMATDRVRPYTYVTCSV